MVPAAPQPNRPRSLGTPQFSCPRPWVPLGQSSRGAGVGLAAALGTGCMREVTILRGKEGGHFWGMRQHVSPECMGTFQGQSHQAHVCVLVCPAESGTDRAGASGTQQHRGHLVCLQSSHPTRPSPRESSSFTGKADQPLPTKFSPSPTITGITSAAGALMQTCRTHHHPSGACSATCGPGYRGS